MGQFDTLRHVPPSASGASEQPTLWQLIARFFADRGWDSPLYAVVSKRAGLDDQSVKRIIDQEKTQMPRGTLLKIAAAMELTPPERGELECAVKQPGSLRETKAELLRSEEISMRRGVLLLTAPTDPHLLPLHSKRRDVATRTGVVFGWHDVVVRVTTPEGRSVLDYADDLFKSGALRTIETIPLRDDLPTYVDRAFSFEDLRTGDYYWAVIFIQALGTPKKPELRDIFHEAASQPDFLGGIHLLTAAVAVGRFDTVVEVLAANLEQLQAYVRGAQLLSNEHGQEIHTVTYFALRWKQRPSVAAF